MIILNERKVSKMSAIEEVLAFKTTRKKNLLFSIKASLHVDLMHIKTFVSLFSDYHILIKILNQK